MPYLFSPPTRTEGVRTLARGGAAQKGLYRFFPTVGVPVCVLITSGVVTEHVVPTVAQVNAATSVFMGGHDTPVSAADKLLLEAAGYIVSAFDGYGRGGYGEGNYGI